MPQNKKPQGIHRRLPINLTDTLIARFWSRVTKGSDSECWNWNACQRNGYGAIKHEGRVLQAHRIAYQIQFGEPDASLVIGHKCDNKLCCNPSHLEAITPGQNNRDARGRCTFHMNRGEHAYNAKLKESDVKRIVAARLETGFGARRLSGILDISESLIRSVIDGKSWAHITGGKVRLST